MAATFLLEQQGAFAAVRHACPLTTAVFNKLVLGETLVKGDKSPVIDGRGRSRVPYRRADWTYVQSSRLFSFPYCTTTVGMWTLDSIDGTKGFLRSGQYAVCLALLVDARVEVGVIGCPNFPITPPPPSSPTNETTITNGDRGLLFVVVRYLCAHQLPLSTQVTYLTDAQSTPL